MLTMTPAPCDAADKLKNELENTPATSALDGDKITWSACEYYARTVVGYCNAADFVVSRDAAGTYTVSAHSPNYAPAWLREFTLGAQGRDLAAVFGEVCEQVRHAWRRAA